MSIRFNIKLILQVMTCLTLFFINPAFSIGDKGGSVFIVVYVAPADGSSSSINERTVLGAEQIIFKKPVPDEQLVTIFAQIQEKPFCKDQNLNCIILQKYEHTHYSGYTIPHIDTISSTQVQEIKVYTYLVDVGSSWPANDLPGSFLLGDNNDETKVIPIEVMVRGNRIYPLISTTVFHTKDNHLSTASLPILISGKTQPGYKLSTSQNFPSAGLVAIAYKDTVHGLAIFGESTLSYSSQSIQGGPEIPTLYYVQQITNEYPAKYDDIKSTPLISIAKDRSSTSSLSTAKASIQNPPSLPQSTEITDIIKSILNQLVVNTKNRPLINGKVNEIEYILPQSFRSNGHTMAVFDQTYLPSPKNHKGEVFIPVNGQDPGPFIDNIQPELELKNNSGLWGHFAIVRKTGYFLRQKGNDMITEIKSNPVFFVNKEAYQPYPTSEIINIKYTILPLSVCPHRHIKDRPSTNKIELLQKIKQEDTDKDTLVVIDKLDSSTNVEVQYRKKRLHSLETMQKTVKRAASSTSRLIPTSPEGNYSISTFQCPLTCVFFDNTSCDTEFSNHSSFLEHVKVAHHNSSHTTTYGGAIKCPLCKTDVTEMDTVFSKFDEDNLNSDSMKLTHHLTNYCRKFKK